MSDAPQKILERDGFMELALKALDDLIARPPTREEAPFFSIRMTSGTSGRTPIIMVNQHKKGTAYGFTHCRALVIAQGGNNARVGNVLFTLGNTDDPARILAVDDTDLTEGLGALLEDLRPDALRGFPSFVRRVGEYLGDARGDVRALRLSGEKWTPSMQEDFERTFPNATFEIIYGTVEVSVVATRECPYLERDHYHPVSDAEIAIHEPDESGVGEMLISRPFYRNFRAERYRVGDMGRIDPEPCACGKMSFEVFGRRGYDFLRIAGATLFRDEFDRVAALSRDLFDKYRVEASRRMEGGKERGHIELTVYRSDGAWSEDIARAIAKRFSEELFLTRTRTLGDLVKERYFDPIVVARRVEPFPFKSKEVTLTERKSTP